MATYDLIFVILGLYHNLMLIALFYSRRNRIELMTLIGKAYLILMLPGSIGILIWAILLDFRWGYLLLLVIIILYLLVEITYDYVLRWNWRKNWKQATPYLAFYYVANYAIVVLNWENSTIWGILLLILFVIQLVVNFWAHQGQKATKIATQSI